MLTPADIRSPNAVSGFKYVYQRTGGEGGKANPWFASKRIGSTRHGWRGPRRATPLEAAQDYCDYMNGQQATPAPVLKSAGHKQKQPKRSKPFSKQQELDRARKKVRELEALKREGSQGFLYLIGMEYPTAFPPRDPGRVNIWPSAVKVGWSENPEARIATLQTGNPIKLVLCATKPGTLEDERALHAKYLHVNILQEWFRPTLPLLLEFGLREAIRGVDRIQVEGVVAPV